MHASLRTAAPALLAAVLLGGGSGMATWVLQGDESAARSGNSAPLDDNHGVGSPTAASSPTVTDDSTLPAVPVETVPVGTVPVPAPTASADDHGGDRPRPRASASADDDPTPKTSDEPTAEASDDHGRNRGRGGDDDRTGDDSSGHGSDD